MGAKSGIALKSLQWFIRAIQFCCAVTVLGIFTYFLVTLKDHNIHINTHVRAIEGIAGAGVLYTLLGLFFVCCLAGLAFFSLFAMLLDLAFAGAFIFVAWENRHGASSCRGTVDTIYGTGNANDRLRQGDNITDLPKFGTACKLQTACLAVSIAAIVFFILSLLMELALVRHHRKEKRFGPGPQNNYTSGYGNDSHEKHQPKQGGGLLARLRGGNKKRNAGAFANDTNALPEHPTPDQVNPINRASHATDTTAVGHNATAGGGVIPAGPLDPYNKYENGGAGYVNTHGGYSQHQHNLPATAEMPGHDTVAYNQVHQPLQTDRAYDRV